MTQFNEFDLLNFMSERPWDSERIQQIPIFVREVLSRYNLHFLSLFNGGYRNLVILTKDKQGTKVVLKFNYYQLRHRREISWLKAAAEQKIAPEVYFEYNRRPFQVFGSQFIQGSSLSSTSNWTNQDVVSIYFELQRLNSSTLLGPVPFSFKKKVDNFRAWFMKHAGTDQKAKVYLKKLTNETTTRLLQVTHKNITHGDLGLSNILRGSRQFFFIDPLVLFSPIEHDLARILMEKEACSIDTYSALDDLAALVQAGADQQLLNDHLRAFMAPFVYIKLLPQYSDTEEVMEVVRGKDLFKYLYTSEKF